MTSSERSKRYRQHHADKIRARRQTPEWRAYHKAYRAANRDRINATAKERYRRNPLYSKPYIAAYKGRKRQFVNEAKNKSCADCGVCYPPWVMQFDHRPGTVKLFVVGERVTRTYASLQTEIKKCDVVCANCHAQRTQERKHWLCQEAS